MPRYIHTATVRGFGIFPIDMLRYDHCYPASETDSGLIIDRERGIREVHVRAVTETKHPPFTAARWDSFMWSVTNIDTQKG